MGWNSQGPQHPILCRSGMSGQGQHVFRWLHPPHMLKCFKQLTRRQSEGFGRRAEGPPWYGRPRRAWVPDVRKAVLRCRYIVPPRWRDTTHQSLTPGDPPRAAPPASEMQPGPPSWPMKLSQLWSHFAGHTDHTITIIDCIKQGASGACCNIDHGCA
ncbi:hypothetical protein SKAU_G00399440 [Synaphobranchus kaupii]|uniref:Uncharacterized protein n=1 Tax=Synaphobranchus kaupii TaxID=118154 RepID=A0A9Q1IBE9_SYNKA|nr:hypothetical protein SKAU_G00399440 [Synaphobranchus kaupii]